MTTALREELKQWLERLKREEALDPERYRNSGMLLRLPNGLAVESRAYELVMLWLDSIGLGLFTVVGVQCAFQQAQDYNLFLLVFVGVITGVGGGVLRDVLSNQKPYIFVKHFYACPPLIGALLCALCWRHLGDIPSMLLGAAVILVLRLCAAHFRWGLPHAADLPE